MNYTDKLDNASELKYFDLFFDYGYAVKVIFQAFTECLKLDTIDK